MAEHEDFRERTLKTYPQLFVFLSATLRFPSAVFSAGDTLAESVPAPFVVLEFERWGLGHVVLSSYLNELPLQTSSTSQETPDLMKARLTSLVSARTEPRLSIVI